jgi:hypothetical protein
VDPLPQAVGAFTILTAHPFVTGANSEADDQFGNSAAISRKTMLVEAGAVIFRNLWVGRAS